MTDMTTSPRFSTHPDDVAEGACNGCERTDVALRDDRVVRGVFGTYSVAVCRDCADMLADAAAERAGF